MKILLENQRVIHDGANSKTFNTPNQKTVILLPKKFASNIVALAAEHITTSSSFESLSDDLKNIIEANHVYQLKSSMLIFTRIKPLKVRSPKRMTHASISN